MAFLDSRAWVPIFYFSLPRQNTNALQTLHVLHKIQVETNRKVIVISTWPFWPWETEKDPSFTSFIYGLNPNIRYFWIPGGLERLVYRVTLQVWRFIQVHEILFRPMDLHSTIRFTGYSTLDHTDIINSGPKVSFHIPKSHKNGFEKKLEELGISPDDWFVCVHAREHGWFKETNAYQLEHPANYRHEQEDHRNVDVRDYLPAIKYITSKGGKIVRMGDPSMTRLPEINGVIDYPFTEHQSLPMDLFLVSRCHFILGCTSGFSGSFPLPFAKPLLITNFPGPVFTARFPYSNTIVMLKHMVEESNGRYLGLRETFNPDIGTMNDSLMFGDLGYQWVSNSPDDILEASKEMLKLIETDSFDAPKTIEQQLFHQYRLEAINSIWSPSTQLGNPRFSNVQSAESRISAAFAKRYFAAENLEPINT